MAHPDESQPTETLVLEESVRYGRFTLVLTGELVNTTAPLLDEEVARVCIYGPEELVLDTRAVSFIDSTGFRAVVKAIACCEAHGVVLLLTRSAPPVQRLFVLTGLDRRLQFIDPSERS
jgi:anti-anti-sigma factor